MKKETLKVLLALVEQEINNYSKERTKFSTQLMMLPQLNSIKEEINDELSKA